MLVGLTMALRWFTGMQRVAIGDAVDAEHDRLAVEHEPLLTGLAGSPPRSTDNGRSSYSRPW
jgi:hypothetical protein